MERKLIILLVEDSQLGCQEIMDYVATLNGMQFAGITANISDVIDHVKNFTPDAIILNLDIHKTNGNGMEFLRQLKKIELPLNPYILVTTNDTSATTLERT